MYSKEELRINAHDVLVWIYRDLIRYDLVQSICSAYIEFCQGSNAERLGIECCRITEGVKLRLLFETFTFSAFLTTMYIPKYVSKRTFFKREIDYELAHYFNNVLAIYLSEMCQKERMTFLQEIVLTSIKPEIRFALGDFLDPLNRLIEYEKLAAEGSGMEGEIYGRYIGKSLDPYHYPILEPLAGPIIKALPQLTDNAMKQIFRA